ASAVESDEDHARAEYVARCFETRANTGRDFDAVTVVRDWPNEFERSERVLFRVERQRGFVFSQIVTIAIVGFFFLKPACVGQKDLQKISGAARTVDWTMKALLNESWQVAGVIDVRVR